MRLLSRVFGRRRPVYHPSCPDCDVLDRLVLAYDTAKLIDMLKTDRRHARIVAASLAYLTGQDFGSDAAAWKSWCRQQKSLSVTTIAHSAAQ